MAMASKVISVFVLCAALSQHAEAQGYGTAMAKFAHAGIANRGVAVANHGLAVAPVNQPMSALNTLAKLEDDNQAMKVAYQGLRARIQKLSQAPVNNAKEPQYGYLTFGFASFFVSAALTYIALTVRKTVTLPQSEMRSGLRSGVVMMSESGDAATLKKENVDEDVTFIGEFGDAVGTDAAGEVVVEERELTEKEKEIARLRAAEKFMMRDTGDAVCKTCGYKYKWEDGAAGVPRKTPFELVPDNWACPNCKSPKAFFDPVQIEIAGFADNQAYGFGTNTMTESQKSTLIFGGLGAFFLLFIGGYALN